MWRVAAYAYIFTSFGSRLYKKGGEVQTMCQVSHKHTHIYIIYFQGMWHGGGGDPGTNDDSYCIQIGEYIDDI